MRSNGETNHGTKILLSSLTVYLISIQQDWKMERMTSTEGNGGIGVMMSCDDAGVSGMMGWPEA